VRVKLLPQEGELYVFVESQARIGKERSMRRKPLKRDLARLALLKRQRPTYATLLRKLGAAESRPGRAAALVTLTLPEPPAKGERSARAHFDFQLDRAKLRAVRAREGSYLLRSNLTETDPAQLWEFYLQLVEVEAAFNLETAVGRGGVCGYGVAGQGATTRNGHSIARRGYAALRAQNHAIYPVSDSPNR
jgi:hypothetical protein